MARIARLEVMTTGHVVDNVRGRSPFTEILEATQVDQGVKITGLESFDGTTDPNDHLSYYENLMICHRYNDITKCRLFISTFKAYARTWFSGLPARSVNSWEEFKAAFLAKFSVNTPHAVHTISLENVKQNPGESLRDYIEKFKAAASKVRELRPTNAVDSFIRNMNYRECKDCCKELCNKEPQDLFETYSIASAYISTDERVRAFYPGSRDEASGSGLRAMQVDGMEDFRGAGQRNFPTDQRVQPRQVREEPNFTCFIKTPSAILEDIRNQEFFQLPTPMRTPVDKRDRTRFCAYHASIGHNTDECTSLKYFLERLVKRDLLREYVQPQGRNGPPPQGRNRPPPQGRNPRPRHVVDMIIGGESAVPERNEVLQLETSQKAFRFSGTTISFSDEDYPRGDFCQNDPLTGSSWILWVKM